MSVLPKMPFSPEKRRLECGCRTVAVAMIAFSCLAYFVDRSFLWAVGVSIVLLWVIIRMNGRRQDRELNEALVTAFIGFEGELPNLEQTNNYGYPHFCVCFTSKEQMLMAFESGHLKAFRSAIEELYGFGGFDIEKAFDETYIGWQADFLASPETDLNSRQWIDDKLKLRNRYYHHPTPHDAEQVADGKPVTQPS